MTDRIGCIGECMLELSSAAHDRMKLSSGGDTLNTAVYFARLGRSVDSVTALGDDPYSDWMIDEWQAEGVGANSALRVPARLPGFYAIRINAAWYALSALVRALPDATSGVGTVLEAYQIQCAADPGAKFAVKFRLRSRTHGGGRQRRPVLPAGRGNRDGSYGRASSRFSFLEILSGLTGGRCRIAQKFRLTLRRCRILPDWWYRSRKSRGLSRTTKYRLRGGQLGGRRERYDRSRLEGH